MNRFFYNIQTLKILSCLWVFLFHFYPVYSSIGGDNIIIKTFANTGYVGQDVFNTISGFIICYIYLHRPFSPISFLKRRYLAIYVTYLPIAFFYFLFYYFGFPQHLPEVNWFKSITLTTTNLSILAIPTSWSLTIFLYFYVIFAILDALKLVKQSTFIILFFIIFCCSIITIHGGDLSPFFTTPYLLEFFAGCLLAFNVDKLSVKLVLGISFIFCCSFVILTIKHVNLDGLKRIVLAGTLALGIVSIAIFAEFKNIRFLNNFTKKFEKTFFAVLLWHPIFIFGFELNYFNIREHITNNHGKYSDIAVIVLLLSIMVFAYLYEKFIDSPIHKIVNKILMRYSSSA